MTYREGLIAKTKELKEANDRKRTCQTKVKEISDEINALEDEKGKIIKVLNNKDLQTPEDVRAAVKKLENLTNTT